jgi:serine phosphatase RsbU (regulator of sigma subunit)
MNCSRRTSCFMIFFVLSVSLYAQGDIDSLEKYVLTASGVEKAKALYLISDYYGPKDTTKSFALAKEAFELSVKTDYKKGVAQYFFFKSRVLSGLGDDKSALTLLTKCLNYIDTIQPNKDLGSYYITLGGVYSDVSKLENSSGAYLKALKIFDKINDTMGIARSYHGLGIVQNGIGNINEAEKDYLKAKKYYEMGGKKDKAVAIIANLGSLFLGESMKSKKESDYKKAYDYISEALSTAIKLKLYVLIGNCYNNLASLYGTENELDVSLDYDFKALQIRREHGLKAGEASSLSNIANVYFLKGRNDLAEKYVLVANEILNELHNAQSLGANYGLLSDIYLNQKKFEKSLMFYKRYAEIRDSLNNIDKIKSMSELEKQYDSEKKDKEIELFKQTQEASDAQIAQQKILNYAIGLGLALVMIFSLFVVRANAQKKKANNLLHFQNNVIEEKNKNITDSINYAKRIQEAILPDLETKSKIFPESFILLQPRDIVSGDFYWFNERNGKRLIAAVDCTGHGVPGAFMSMIGNAFINEVVNERGITEPGMILSELRHLVIKALKQKGAGGEQGDGMDISLLSFSKDNKTADWAGANNPLWLIRNGEIIEYKPDKRPIGFFMGKGLPFTNHTIEIQKDDVLYVFTDGYADQFGGNKEGGKKFKLSRLKTLLLSLQNLSMDEQKKKLEQTITDWQGELEQVDDICVIGIKI